MLSRWLKIVFLLLLFFSGKVTAWYSPAPTVSVSSIFNSSFLIFNSAKGGKATYKSASQPGRQGVYATFTSTLQGRRHEAARFDLTAAATKALNASEGGGPTGWESELPPGADRFSMSVQFGSHESPVQGDFFHQANLHGLLRLGVQKYSEAIHSKSAAYYHQWAGDSEGLSKLGLHFLGSSSGFAESFPHIIGIVITSITGNYLAAHDVGVDTAGSLSFGIGYTLASPFAALYEAATNKNALTGQTLTDGERSDRVLASAFILTSIGKGVTALSKRLAGSTEFEVLGKDYIPSRPMRNVTPVQSPPPQLALTGKPQLALAGESQLLLPGKTQLTLPGKQQLMLTASNAPNGVGGVAENAGRLALPAPSGLMDINVNGVFAQRIIHGTNGKMAVIGRSMGDFSRRGEYGVIDYARELRRQGYETELFVRPKLSQKAIDEIEALKSVYGNELPAEVIYQTRAWAQNVKWAWQVKRKGYTIIDVGDPNSKGFSPFYNTEKSIIFGD